MMSREPHRLRWVELPNDWFFEWGPVACYKIADLAMQERLISMAMAIEGPGICSVDYR